MLSFAGERQVSRIAGWVGAACALAVLTSVASVTPARTQEVEVGGCVGIWHAFNCVTRWAPAGDPYIRTVPKSLDAGQRALARERDRRWADRCRPVIRQDRYGVPRYYYAEPGCEFGIGEYDQN